MPDYAAKQKEFERRLNQKKAELKAQVNATAPQPFTLHESGSDPIAKVSQDIAIDTKVLPETRWPYVSSREPQAAKAAPPSFHTPVGGIMGKTKGGEASKPPKSFTARTIVVKKNKLDQMVAAREQLKVWLFSLTLSAYAAHRAYVHRLTLTCCRRQSEEQREMKQVEMNRQVASSLKAFEVERQQRLAEEQAKIEQKKKDFRERTKEHQVEARACTLRASLART